MKHILFFINLALLSIIGLDIKLSAQSCKNAQLEMAAGAGNPTASGPSVADQVITFQNNTNNPSGVTMAAYTPSLTATYSISNQQYTAISGLTGTYANGMVYGSAANSTTALLYDNMGAIGSANATNFSSTPNNIGTGIDLNANYGAYLKLATRPLQNSASSLTGSYYYGDLTITFNQAVNYPILQMADFGGFVTSGTNHAFSLQAKLISGQTLTRLSGDAGVTLVGTDSIASVVSGSTATTNFLDGSFMVNGTGITSITLKLYLKGHDNLGAWSATAAGNTGREEMVIGVTIPDLVPNAPVPTSTSLTNYCPSVAYNLDVITPAAIAGQTYEWHTVDTLPTAGDLVTNTSAQTGTGPFYLYAKDNLTGCYSPASAAVNITQTACPLNTCTEIFDISHAPNSTISVNGVDVTYSVGTVGGANNIGSGNNMYYPYLANIAGTANGNNATWTNYIWTKIHFSTPTIVGNNFKLSELDGNVGSNAEMGSIIGFNGATQLSPTYTGGSNLSAQISQPTTNDPAGLTLGNIPTYKLAVTTAVNPDDPRNTITADFGTTPVTDLYFLWGVTVSASTAQTGALGTSACLESIVPSTNAACTSPPYKIYAHNRPNSTNTSNLPVQIIGTSTVNATLDQRTVGTDLTYDGTGWKEIASGIVPDATGKIDVKFLPNSTTNGTYMFADAILISNGFVTTVLDEGMTGYSQTGTWVYQTGQTDAYTYAKDNYYASPSPFTGRTATWSFTGLPTTVTPPTPQVLSNSIVYTCINYFQNLNSLITPAGTLPAGYSYQWHTVGSNPTPATLIPNPTHDTTAGTKYLYIVGPTGCISPASAPVVTNAKPVCADCDGDGVPNDADSDDDNDGVLDVTESDPTELVTNGSFAGGTPSTMTTGTSTTMFTNWTTTASSGTSGNITYNGGIPYMTLDGGTASIEQTLPPVCSVDKIKLDISWNDGAVNASTGGGFSYTSFFSVLYGGTEYAKITTTTGNNVLPSGTTLATIEYLNGAYGNLNTLNNVVYSSNTLTPNWVINLPSGTPGGGILRFQMVGGSPFPGDDFRFDNVSVKGTKDTDGDGICNSCDLDSDGDGCSDAFESGATTNLSANYSFPPPVNSNGVSTSVPVYTSTYSKAIDSTIHTCVICGTFNAGADKVVCQNSTTMMNASKGAGTFTWTALGSNPAVVPITTPTDSATVVGPFTVAGIYKFVWSSGPSCSDTVQVTVNPSPVVSVSGTSPICLGASSTMTASGASTYLWSPGNLTGSSQSLSPTATTTYVVTGTDANGCTDTAQLLVVVNPLPVVSVSGISPICAGTSSAATATGSSSYVWNPGNLSGASQSVSPAMTTTYTITGTDANGCMDTAQLLITVEPLPAAPTATLVQPTCTNPLGTITITAPTGTGMTYSIDGMTYTNTNGIFNNVAPGNYNLTVKSVLGCISLPTPVTIEAQPPSPALPTVTLTQPTCAVATGVITVTTPTGVGFMYSIDGTDYSNTTGIFSGVASGSYNVTVKNAEGCISPALTVVVDMQPATPIAPTISPSASTICSGTTITLAASGCSGDVTWFALPDTTTSIGSGSSIMVTPIINTSYVTRCTNPTTGCFSPLSEPSVITVVTPPPGPNISISKDSVCAGDVITLTGQSCASPFVLTWFKNGSMTPFASGLTVLDTPGVGTTTYMATCNGLGAVDCASGSTSITVVVSPLPATPAITPNPVTICSGSSTTLSASGAGSGEILIWSDGHTGNPITVSPPVTTIYTVKIVNQKKHCESVVSMPDTVTVIQSPVSPPEASIIPASICAGDSATIAADCSLGNAVWYLDPVHA